MIHIQEVSKKFKVYPSRAARLREWVLGGKYHQEFWALHKIDLKIESGEVFGIIGMNGAGKSTLLKILTGTLAATSGKIEMQGRVAALLELGTGFHPELSGRDNVLMNGKLLGLTESEIIEKIPGIHAFSELGDFFEKPVRTYSSGMYVRLAFSLAASVDPDVLIIDEALSVGDAYFQQKCLERIKQFKEQGTTILFVSHDPGVVKVLCNRVAFLQKGKLLGIGDPVEMLERYNALLSKQDGHGTEYIASPDQTDVFGREKRITGNKKATITSVQLKDMQGNVIEALVAAEPAVIEVGVGFHTAIDEPTVGILIRDRLGVDVFGTNSFEMSQSSGSYQAGETATFKFSLKMNLGPGDYTVTAAVHSSNTHLDDCFEWVDRILSFKVLPRTDFQFLGLACLEPVIEIEKNLTSN